MRRALPLLSILVLLAAACGGKTPPAPEALTGEKILSAVQDLEKAYSRKDLDGVMSLITPQFADREGLSRTLKDVFARYDTVVLAFQKTRMLVELPERGDARITLNWEGEWHSGGGNLQKDGGRVTLILDRKSFQLTAIDGRTPFVPAQKRPPGNR